MDRFVYLKCPPSLWCFHKITKKCGGNQIAGRIIEEGGRVWCEREKSVNFWHARSVKFRPPFRFYYQSVTDTPRVSKPRVHVPSRRVVSEKRDLFHFVFFFVPFLRSCSGGNGPAAPASSAVKSHPLLNRAPSSGQTAGVTHAHARARASGTK